MATEIVNGKKYLRYTLENHDDAYMTRLIDAVNKVGGMVDSIKETGFVLYPKLTISFLIPEERAATFNFKNV